LFDGESEGASWWFALLLALLGRFDAVIEAVAQEVEERGIEALEDAAVDLDGVSLEGEVHLFVQVMGEVPGEFGEEFEEGEERLHHGLAKSFLEGVDLSRERASVGLSRGVEGM